MLIFGGAESDQTTNHVWILTTTAQQLHRYQTNFMDDMTLFLKTVTEFNLSVSQAITNNQANTVL